MPAVKPSQGPQGLDKVTRYEHFLNEVLRADLKTTLAQRDELYNEIAQYMELQTIVEKLASVGEREEQEEDKPKEKDKPKEVELDHLVKLRTRVDLGANFYVQAEIPEMKEILVDVGCGIWLPMAPNKAMRFCEKKLFYLNARADQLTQKEVSVKAQIKLVLEGLREIQGLPQQEAAEGRKRGSLD